MTDLDRRARELAERLEARRVWVSLDFRVAEPTAAEVLGVTVRTLRTWRTEGRAPRFYDAGRLTYRIIDLLIFLESRAHDSQSMAAIGNMRK
jgi:hypothetical protein